MKVSACVGTCIGLYVITSPVCYLHFLTLFTFLLAQVDDLQGAPKSKPLGKIRYLWNCSNFFRQIYDAYRGGFRHIVQISLQYLVACKNYNYLNSNVHFSKWTSNQTAILTLKITSQIFKSPDLNAMGAYRPTPKPTNICRAEDCLAIDMEWFAIICHRSSLIR